MSAITSVSYLPGLRRAIESGSERTVHAHLKRYQRPLWVAFAHGWNAIMVAPEFRFGRKYRADFLVMSSHSGALHAAMVELEPPRDRLYNRSGTESKRLVSALRQLKDWSIWVDDHPEQYRREVADEIERTAEEDRRVPRHRHAFLRSELLDHRRVILAHYAVVIGRRAALSAEDAQRRGNESRWKRGLEIATYDRLLDIGMRDKARQLANRADLAAQTA